MASALRENWTSIQGKCATETAELEAAEKMAMHILRLVGLREQRPVTAASSAATRAKALTLVVNDYDQVRRAVAYVRWDHEDADTIDRRVQRHIYFIRKYLTCCWNP